MPEKTTYEAVLFDLDGTLLDTLEDLGESANTALRNHGLAEHPIDAYRIFVGDGVATLISRAAPDARPGEELHSSLVRAFREEYARRWDNVTKPYDGIAEMLDDLQRRGLRCTVLSNKPHDFTKLCVERFLGNWTFDIVQGVSDTVPPKPDPAGAKGVCARLEVPPERFVYLGDTNTDMRTANAAGMFAVGVTWGFRSAEELREFGADALIDHPSELARLLETS